MTLSPEDFPPFFPPEVVDLLSGAGQDPADPEPVPEDSSNPGFVVTGSSPVSGFGTELR
jgi:hypothetical protein